MTSYDITVRQGDAFDFSVTYKSDGAPVDLTGYTAEMVITWPAFRNGVIPPIDAGEVNLTMDALGSDGVIGAHLTAAQTSTIPVGGPGLAGPVAQYQLRVDTGGDPDTLLAGGVIVYPDLFALVT